MTGQSACAYCDVDLTSDYYRWLPMQVDHVVPVSVGRSLGIPEEYIEDAINKVLACSGCNGFLNRYTPIAEISASWSVDAFVALRDSVFVERKRNIQDRRATEIQLFESRPWEIAASVSDSPWTSKPSRTRFELDRVPGVIEFVDSDAGYLAWIADHSNGFVVNAERRPRASYLILHRATCGTITGKPARGLVWTRAFIKACSVDLVPLGQWSSFHTGGTLQPCGRCKPVTVGSL
jgi:hypothetical protein